MRGMPPLHDRSPGLVALALLALVVGLVGAQEAGGEPAAEQAPIETPIEAPAAPPGEAPDEAPDETLEGPTQLAPEEIEQLVDQVSRAEATQIASQDAALSERLRSIFAALDDLPRLRVDVQAGIVVLSGSVPTRDDADSAAEIARALPGVVLVVDEITLDRSMTRRLTSSWAKGVNQLRDAVAFLPLLGVGLLIVVLAWLLARFLRDADLLYRFLRDRNLLQNLLRQTVFAAVILGGIMAALRFLDAGALIGTALGAAGVVGLALGFAFRNIVENYLAGILLAIRQPFRLRDDVNIDGAKGTVLRMTSSETTLLDADGNHLRLPNAMIFNGKVLNYTRNPLRRFTVSVGVGTDVDLGRAQKLGVETLQRMNGMAEDPAPSARVTALGDSTVQLELFGWVDQRNANFIKAASEAKRLVKTAYDQAGIAMPAPAYLVQLDAPLAGAALPGAPSRPAAPEPPVADSGPPPEEVDLSAEEDVTRQVEQEIARSGEDNLLADPDPTSAG